MAPGCGKSNLVNGGSVESKLGNYFNQSCFTTPPIIGADGIGTGFGDSATGIVDGPGQFNIDLSLARNVPIPWPKEGSSLQFRAESFNVLNHPQFSNPNTTFGSMAEALFGVNVKTTLAGLGIGGLAIALGAQKTLENLIGGVSLLMDKAVHAGDFCEIGGKLGTVEDIGLRSLRLRTLDQNLLVVPNSALAQMQFQNMKARSKLLISQNFSLRIETSADQLRTVLDRVQQMLNEHPFVESGTSRIRIADFAGASFQMELWAYVKTGDWAYFTGIRQDIILKIADFIESTGTRLAAPTRLTYVSADPSMH